MNYWTTTGYRYPDTPHATVKPGEKGFKLWSGPLGPDKLAREN
jgi:hypothetical protein